MKQNKTIMKKYLITTALMLGLTFLPAASVVQAQPAAKVAVAIADSTQQKDEVEAFSDTTDTMTSAVTITYDGMDDDDLKEFERFIKIVSDNPSTNMLVYTMLGTIFVFVIAPIIVLALLFWFIYKNRKQRIQLAQQALQSGQQIPNEMTPPAELQTPDIWTKGVRQVALGAGLAIFLGLIVGEVGLGIGALVLCIGLGNLYIAYSKKKENQQGNRDFV